MSGKKTVTIYDIAREAGVSVSTVSRVLTNNARVTSAKKERVLEAVNRYNFKPNALAKSLSETKSKIIGIITADIRNPFYATLFAECERAANELGYTMMLCNSFGDPKLEESQMEKLFTQRVDAIIQIGGHVDDFVSDEAYVDRVNRIANSIPIIITGKLDGSDCYQVNIDEGLAMELVLDYLISLGHKDIALVGGRKNVKSTIDKRSRYKQLLSRNNIPFHSDYIVEARRYDDESGYECMNRLFEVNKLPTAVIAINDFTAVGVIRAITEKGLSIPKDISVASFDNTYIAKVTIPKITAISYNYREFGEQIIQTAIHAMNGIELSRVSLVRPTLIIRESCAASMNHLINK